MTLPFRRFRSLMLPLGFFLVFSWTLTAFAWQPRSRDESLITGAKVAPVVGTTRTYLIGLDETLIDLARRSGIGYTALTRANPGIDPWLPPVGSEILLPQSAIVPGPLQPGIVINLAEMRLYVLWREKSDLLVRFYPIGIGREGRETPLGSFRVANRAKDPTWTPPPSIRAERPELPASIQPGPQNPLGEYWIGLNAHRIGLHGTNKPYGIGREVSSGCIRLYPEHIRDLFDRVQVGTPVTIIYQPIKVGLQDQALYLEVHPDERGVVKDPLNEVMKQKAALGNGIRLDIDAVNKALREQNGIPVRISVD